MSSRGCLGSAACLAAALAVVFTCAPAAACPNRQFTIAELTRHAAVIVEGRVTAVSSAGSADKSQIHTRVTIDVNAYHKGRSGKGPFELSLLGGSVDDVSLFIVGQPEFQIGDEVFLFVASRSDTGFPIVGLSEGYFRVEKDQTSSDPLLRGRSQALRRSQMLAAIEQVLATVPSTVRN